MSGVDKPSASGSSADSSGAERGDRTSASPERPFPGAPLDRPSVSPPSGEVRSWEDIKEDKHRYSSQAEYEAVLKERREGAAAQGSSDGVREPGERRPEEVEPGRFEKAAERPFPGAPLDRPSVSPPSGEVRSWEDIKEEKARFASQREYEQARAAEKDAPAPSSSKDAPAREKGEPAGRDSRPQPSSDRDAGSAERERSGQETAERDGERADDSGSDAREETAAPETRRSMPEQVQAEEAAAADAGLSYPDSPRREPAEVSETPTPRMESDASGLTDSGAGDDEEPSAEASGQDAARAGSDRGARGDDGGEPGEAPPVTVAGEVVRDSPREAGDAASERIGEKERAGDIRADASGDETETLRQEIASLKADNAQHKAEIDGLKAEIAEIREALKARNAETAEGPLGDEGVLMHAHSEFLGEELDLYTDGTRWTSGEALDAAQKKDPQAGQQGIVDVPGMRDQGIDVIGERPDDESELPPDRKELLEADDRKKSLAERLLDRVEDDEVIENLQEKGASHVNALEEVFEARPPTQSLQYHTDLPYMAPTQQHAAAGDIFSAAFVASVALAEVGRRIHDMLSRRREGR